MIVTQSIIVNDSVAETLSNGTGTAVIQTPESPTFSFANGTSTAGTVPGVIDLYWSKGKSSGADSSITLAAAGTVTHTYSALTDDLGRAVAFARLRRWSIRITSKTAGDWLTVGGAGTHANLDIVIPRVLDYALFVANDAVGFVIASGSHDQILITNNGANPITFELAASGCST